REPFMLFNLYRKNKKRIWFGHVYSYRNEKKLTHKIFYNWAFKKIDGFLVHSDYIKNRLQKQTNKPIYSFNNTYFYKSDIKKLPFTNTEGKLNVIWVGRYRN